MTGIRNAHTSLRKRWAAVIRQHGWTCRRCHQPITPTQQWDLGHPDDATPGGPTSTRGLEPEHAHCNRSAGATAGNYLRANPLPPTRDW